MSMLIDRAPFEHFSKDIHIVILTRAPLTLHSR